MNINKLRNFYLSEVTKINNSYVINVDETHFIGSFLSTTEVAPISMDGVRYKVISNINFNSVTVNAEVYSIPTGVTQDLAVPIFHQAFRFKDLLAYIPDEDSVINLYINDEIVCNITNIKSTDKLVLITDQLIDPQSYHVSSKHPHEFRKYYLDQPTINKFESITDLDIKGDSLPSYSEVLSSYCITPSFDKFNYDLEYLFEGNPLDRFILDEDRLDEGLGPKFITKEIKDNIIPVFNNKFI